ncbi:MFS general substrate transporter [Colletotrichum eremochloae]|nr:MFS general substrate transporter [Colletotrichum eremochloae]
MAEPKVESQYVSGSGAPVPASDPDPAPAPAPASGPESLTLPLGDDAAPIEPYSVFTRTEKCPLPANIYLPVIPELSEAFVHSVEDINLTVTAFLAMQGVSPMLWGPLSDRYGRRPIFLVCLIVLIGACVGIAVIPTDDFWLLVVLRCLQATGSASTVALGAGVIGDISTPEERGGFFGMFNLGAMPAFILLYVCPNPSISRAVHWSSDRRILPVRFLPETLRSLIGNGSVSPGGVYMPLVPVVGRPRRKDRTPARSKQAGGDGGATRSSLNPFVILVYPDVAITLAFTGVVHAVNNTVVTTVASSFADVYPWLSETALGLCYLPTGFGMIVGTMLTGKILDWDYARIKRRVEASDGGSSSSGGVLFPKEYAPLRTMPVLLVLFSGAVVAWGFCVDRGVHIAVPLVLQVVLGYTSMAILSTTMTLMVDILQTRSSAAMACTNLVRCLLAALLVGLIDKMTLALRISWSYVLLGGVCALLLPLIYIEMKVGPKWRLKRDLKSVDE